MINPEHLEEGWVKFSRFNCTEGCIDIWYGDCAHNPNSKEQPRWNLNAFSTFIRLNGEGKWYSNEYRKGINGFTGEMSETKTSQEIWDEISKYNYEENGK
jgi:hypothetical protein